jgi:hypothetical protein
MSWEKSKDELREEFSRQVNKRKPTNKWCKGKVGREHTPELVINHNYTRPGWTCGWKEIMAWRNGERGHWKWHYSCKHSYRCTTCGKYTEDWLKNKEECPEFTPKPAEPAV